MMHEHILAFFDKMLHILHCSMQSSCQALVTEGVFVQMEVGVYCTYSLKPAPRRRVAAGALHHTRSLNAYRGSRTSEFKIEMNNCA